MTKFKLNPVLLSLLIATPMTALAENTSSKSEVEAEPFLEHIQILGRSNKLRTESGSATLIDELELEKFEYDDIHRVLANVPGVNIRQEDGYGLRPNIGFRGVTPERSKKINILEDGVLIGPAPYSAPAAYYFPSVNRMTSVEVFKGPAAIKYGPNTVAGTINLTTRAVPDSSEGQIEFGFGSDGYRKTQGFYGNSFEIGQGQRLGFLVDAVKSQADGFKDIDNAATSLYDEDSGFEKNDFMFKLNYGFDRGLFGLDGSQIVELKVSKSDENSNETYLGLTDADFAATPYRRYAATQAGNMDWEHDQVQLTHHFQSEAVSLTTRLYKNDFERAWRKVNNFVNTGNAATERTIQEILANPEEGINANYYQVLTGQKDSESLFEQIVVGTNDRSYFSKGIQTDLKLNLNLFNTEHLVSTGVRYHQDRIDRDHFEQNYLMTSGVMTPSSQGPKFTTVNYEETDAISIYLEDTIKLGKLMLTAGGRGEILDSRYQNEAAGKEADWLEKETTTWLYSVSAFYHLNNETGLFAGVHEGYVPTSPKQAAEIKPEESTNYEIGARYNDGRTKFESVFFFNDFNNLKESCSFSTSASCASTTNIDQEYNGGEVDVSGLEFSLSSTESLNGDYDLPWSITFTQTESEFKQDLNSTFELWGDVKAGDPVPYLPEQQLTVNLGIAANNWQVSLLVKYLGEMHEASGDNVTLSGQTTDSYTVVDLSASYDLQEYGSVYLKVDNITDETALVSRRPFGARPSKPQQLFVGYKYQF